MKKFIYFKLCQLRDIEWLPDWLVDIIDFIRYEYFYEK